MNTQNKKTLIVVDGNIKTQKAITLFFNSHNFEVLCFNNPFDVLEELKSNGETWDLVITDYHFSDMSPLDFNSEIKKIKTNLEVLGLTQQDSLYKSSEVVQSTEKIFPAQTLHLGQLLVSVNRALQNKILNTATFENKKSTNTPPLETNTLIGQSSNFLAAMEIAKRVAKSSASILILGESGTGKEVFANFIHKNSKHFKGPFTAINCSSIPENLLESELFGHAKGAFTGALESRTGLFEAAENGTLFLDEIGDLSLPLQAKLLRVLQEKKIKRVGENLYRPINCRIISATNKDLSFEISEGNFREDLFFRLNTVPIYIPPLRDRIEDLVLLADTFLKKFSTANGSHVKSFSKSAIKYILENRWQGNVRELENSVERAVVLCTGSEISLENFIPLSTTDFKIKMKNLNSSESEHTFVFQYMDHLPSLDEVINKYIHYAVEINGGAKDKTAKDIGIDRKTLYKRVAI